MKPYFKLYSKVYLNIHLSNFHIYKLETFKPKRLLDSEES